MFLFLLFSTLLQTTDTSTICSASCSMYLKNETSLKVSEKRLLKLSGDAQYAEKQPCTKIIEDSITKKSFKLDQWISWLAEKKKGKISEIHVGSNKVIFVEIKKSDNVSLTIEPDDCNCKWTTIVKKEMLPFVKESLQYIVFKEN